MWKDLKTKKSNTILCLEYEEFAYVEIDKIKKDNINFFSLELEIYDTYNNNFVLYKMDDVLKVLSVFKEEVEQLYDRFNDLSKKELDDFLDDLDEKLNNY